MIFSKRKWGWWLVLLSRKRFKIKLLYFRSGQSCSMQKHFQRAETWLVLSGKGAMVWVEGTGKFTQNMESGFSTQVPVDTWHQFTAQKSTLVLEVQTGKCFEEDIERK